jgi:hypothetical protein
MDRHRVGEVVAAADDDLGPRLEAVRSTNCRNCGF